MQLLRLIFLVQSLMAANSTRTVEYSVNCTTNSTLIFSEDKKDPYRLNTYCITSSTNTDSIWISWRSSATVGSGTEMPPQTFAQTFPMTYQGPVSCISASGTQLLSCTVFY